VVDLNFCPHVFQRHGVAVFLAITMCTSLLFVYSVSYSNNTTASSASKGASGEKVEPTSAPRAPPALQGYSSIIEHKVNGYSLSIRVKLSVTDAKKQKTKKLCTFVSCWKIIFVFI